MRSNDYRAYYHALVLCDGRCFYSVRDNPARKCDHAALVYFEDVPSNAGLPLAPQAEINSDHMTARARGGADAVSNYVAACAACNKSRQDTPMADSELDRAAALRNALNPWPMSGSFDEPAENLLARKARSDVFDGHLTFPALRCRVHGWHLRDAPAADQCFHLRDFTITDFDCNPMDRALWVFVFGDESQTCYSKLTASAIWRSQEDRAYVFLTIARSISGRAALLTSILDTCRNCDDVKAWSVGTLLDPHPTALLGLSPSSSTSLNRAALSQDTRDASGGMQKYGVDWPRLSQLFLTRQWPDFLIVEHAAALSRFLRQHGGRRKLLEELQRASDWHAAERVLDSRLGSGKVWSA